MKDQSPMVTITSNYHNTTSPKGISDRLAFRLTDEDKRAMQSLRDLLRPRFPFATRTDLIRVALKEAERVLAEQSSRGGA
jgi:hypothetical protein